MNNKEIQASAASLISELISLPKEMFEKLKWYDILLLVVAWASGVLFSKFSDVIARDLKN